MTFLILSLAALASGPLVFTLIQGRPNWEKVIDGFIFVAISGLVVLHIFPSAVEQGGWFALAFGFIGLIGPSFSEKVLHQKVHRAHIIALGLAVVGILLHAGMDGASLSLAKEGFHDSMGHEGPGELLALAVILHRVPVSLTLWWLIQPQFGPKKATLVLVTLGLATVVGFFTVPEGIQSTSLAWFQAFVAGSLLHVVLHQSHKHKDLTCHCHPTPEAPAWYAGIGNVFGVLLLVFLGQHHHVIGESQYAAKVRETFIQLTLDMAPALVLAYLLAGLVSIVLSHKAILWLGKGNAWSQAARGMAVGLPLPICSCGVVPIYHSLVTKGAPVAAAMAFFIATPELGIDAILISIPLLGTEMTLIRIVAAALVAFLVGGIAGRMVPNHHKPLENKEEKPALTSAAFFKGWKNGLMEIVDSTSPWILLGLIVAALVSPIMESGWMSPIPGVLEVPVFALLGLPLYVCATGATPLVAVLLWSHISPGAALAFLLTGPATNLSTFGVLTRLHGRKIAAAFAMGTFLCSILAGYAVNGLFPGFEAVKPVVMTLESYSVWTWIGVVVLCLLVAFSLLKRGAREFLGELVPRMKG